MKERSKLQRVGIDIAGVLLIIAAAITSPIPGPGGIPLLILGLSLLATNHEWAERLLLTVKKHGLNISDKIFSDKPGVKIALDLLSIVLVAGAVILVTQATRSIFKTAAISLVLLALLLFFGNRKRGTNIKRRFRSNSRNKT